MTAPLITDAGSSIPEELMPEWCRMWADGDRRLRVEEISVNVLGVSMWREPGTLWERVAEGVKRG